MMKKGWLFQEIEIETVNRCNGKCAFCPVNATEPQREYAKMSDDVFCKIIDNLERLEFKGKISLFSNNEPFLDERIIEFYAYANRKLPNAYFNIFTNGSLLTIEKLKDLISYIDYMVIDNYTRVGKDNHLEEVYEFVITHEDIGKKVHFNTVQEDAVRLSRGGQAPNKKGTYGIDELCLLPYRQMVIRPTGEVSLCCNDALGKYTLGNVNYNSLEEIWKSKTYEKLRREMYKHHRKNLRLCRDCDTPTSPYVLEPKVTGNNKSLK